MIRLLVNYNPLGFSPYWLLPGVESMHAKTNNTIAPINGTKTINTHQPDLSVSCKRRTATAKLGRNNAAQATKLIIFVTDTKEVLIEIRIAPTILKARFKRKLKRVNIQYS